MLLHGAGAARPRAGQGGGSPGPPARLGPAGLSAPGLATVSEGPREPGSLLAMLGGLFSRLLVWFIFQCIFHGWIRNLSFLFNLFLAVTGDFGKKTEWMGQGLLDPWGRGIGKPQIWSIHLLSSG